jgi:hypothetical protein
MIQRLDKNKATATRRFAAQTLADSPIPSHLSVRARSCVRVCAQDGVLERAELAEALRRMRVK